LRSTLLSNWVVQPSELGTLPDHRIPNSSRRESTPLLSSDIDCPDSMSSKVHNREIRPKGETGRRRYQVARHAQPDLRISQRSGRKLPIHQQFCRVKTPEIHSDELGRIPCSSKHVSAKTAISLMSGMIPESRWLRRLVFHRNMFEGKGEREHEEDKRSPTIEAIRGEHRRCDHREGELHWYVLHG
jgi:hypothetical protein